MTKLVALSALSLSIFCMVAEPATAAPDQSLKKRSLAMTALPGAIAPPVVAKPMTKAVHKLPTKAALQAAARATYPRSHFAKALYFKSKGNINAALIEFLKTTQENPRIVRAFYEQALIFRKKHFLKLAESSLEQALTIKSDYQDARILLATVRIEQGNLGGAMEELSRSLGLPADKGRKSATASATSTADRQPAGSAGNPALREKAPAVLQSLHSMLSEIPAYFRPPARSEVTPSRPGPQPIAGCQQDALGGGGDKKRENGFALRRYPQIEKNATSGTDRTDGTSAKVSQEATATLSDHAAASEQPAKEKEPRSLMRIPKSLQFRRRKADKTKEQIPEETALSKEIGEKLGVEKGPLDTNDITQSLKSGSLSPSKTAATETPLAAEQMTGTTQAQDRLNDESDNNRKSVAVLNFEPAQPGEAPSSSAQPFQVPQLPSASSALLAPLAQTQGLPAPGQDAPDEWTKKLLYLEEHGTASLSQGEAFMFSEDTGEATLFLADGGTIRRNIAKPRDTKEVVRERRPDILIPDELMYNLSLLGKLMPKPAETDAPQYTVKQKAEATGQQPGMNFDFNKIMDGSDGLWGWFKRALKF